MICNHACARLHPRRAGSRMDARVGTNSRRAGDTAAPLALAVILPTFKEAGNIDEIVRRLDAALDGVAWEAIFVDDHSPDGTAERIREIGRTDRRIRCLERVGRRGLASA